MPRIARFQQEVLYLFQTTISIFSLHILLDIPNVEFVWVWAPWACCNIPGRNVSQGNRRNHRNQNCLCPSMPAKTTRCFKGSDVQAVWGWTGVTTVRIRWWCGVCGVCAVCSARGPWKFEGEYIGIQSILPIILYFLKNSYLLPFGLLFHVATSSLSSKGCRLLAEQISIEFFFLSSWCRAKYRVSVAQGPTRIGLFPDT